MPTTEQIKKRADEMISAASPDPRVYNWEQSFITGLLKELVKSNVRLELKLESLESSHLTEAGGEEQWDESRLFAHFSKWQKSFEIDLTDMSDFQIWKEGHIAGRKSRG